MKAIIIFFLALAALIFAYISQYGFGLFPCKLCWWQRYPYFGILTLSSLTFFLSKYNRILLVICVGLFVTDAIIAFYHTGVEQKIFSGFSDCSAPSFTGLSLEELRTKIINAPTILCDEATILLWGISMALANAIYATFCAIFSIIYLRKKWK